MLSLYPAVAQTTTQTDECSDWECPTLHPALFVVISLSNDLDGDGLTRLQEDNLGTDWRVADYDS